MQMKKKESPKHFEQMTSPFANNEFDFQWQTNEFNVW